MTTRYGRVTRQTIEELRAIAGREAVFTDRDVLEEYSRDESPHVEPHAPQVVAKPPDSDTVARLLAFANEKRIPITPMGARTGISGGCIPIHGGIVLSLERMDRIIEIDRENFVAVVEPGVTLSDLCAQVEEQGLYYPSGPAR